MMMRLFRGARALPEPTVCAAVAPDERIYAVGDIHGRHDLLIALLRRIAADAAGFDDGRRFRLVFLGDYVDRGDDSRGVLDTLSRLWDGGLPQVDFLLGNHEAALLDFIADPVASRGWLDFGAAQTLASYGVVAPSSGADDSQLLAVRDEFLSRIRGHMGFLRALVPIVRSGDVVFSHAGVCPNRPLEDQAVSDLVWGHPAFLGDQPAPGLRIVHGHWDDFEPVSRPGRICVDTGAYYSGRLTAVRLDAEETYISVDVATVGT